MAAVFVGGLTRHLLTRSRPAEEAERRREEGVLFGSGLVGGGGLTGVVLAIWVVARGGEPIVGFPPSIPDFAQQILAVLTIAAIVGLLVWHVRRVPRRMY
jgi:hypothetical protein